MNKQSVAKLVLSSQDETFIYFNEEGNLVIQQPAGDQFSDVVIVGKSHVHQFAEMVMELAMMRSDDK